MKKIRLLFWIEAAFYLIFGIFLLLKPELALKTIIIVCGIYAIVSGFAGLVFTIREIEYYDRFLLGIISGVSAVFGILLLCFPQIGETIIKVCISLLGITIVVKGSFMVHDSLYLRKQKIDNRFWTMIMGCLLILLGVLMEMNGIMTVLLFNRLIGLCLISGGIAMLVWSFQVNKLVKDVKKELNNVKSVEIEIK